MITLAGLLEDQTEPAPVLVNTGLTRLDNVAGGLRRGQVWIVTGRPGEGTSLLLLQIALRSALARHQTEFYAPRQNRHDLKQRIVAHVSRRAVNDAVREASEGDLGLVASLPMRVYAGPRAAIDSDSAVNEVVVIDDAALTATAENVCGMSRCGRVVVLGLPCDEVVTAAGLRQSWARLADVIFEVKTGGWSWDDPSEPPTIRMLKKRWGPRCVQSVAFAPGFTRFREFAGEQV